MLNIIELMPKAKLIIETCMAIKPGEVVFVLGDTRNRNFAEMLAAAASQIGADVSLGIMPTRKMFGNEPPRPIAAAFAEAEHILITAQTGTAHTTAVKNALKKGAQAAVMTEISEDYLAGLQVTVEDMELIRERVNKVADLLTKAKRARAVSKLGTDIQMDITGRISVPLQPFSQKGKFNLVPDYSEAAIAPVEGSAKGTVVIDGSVTGVGLLTEPIRITVKEGRVVAVEGGDQADKLRTILKNSDENAYNLAELGIGLSHTGGRTFMGTTWDKRIIGTAHIGMGRNNGIGGVTHSTLHCDGIFRDATIYLDDKVVIADNQVQI